MFDDDDGYVTLLGSLAILVLAFVLLIKLCHFPVVWISTGSFGEAWEMLIDSNSTEALLGIVMSIIMLIVVCYMVID
tara:strand:- start:315 stop:545 length:231 start_codon:yes stop_codon:yes gene_type:complete